MLPWPLALLHLLCLLFQGSQSAFIPVRNQPPEVVNGCDRPTLRIVEKTVDAVFVCNADSKGWLRYSSCLDQCRDRSYFFSCTLRPNAFRDCWMSSESVGEGTPYSDKLTRKEKQFKGTCDGVQDGLYLHDGGYTACHLEGPVDDLPDFCNSHVPCSVNVSNWNFRCTSKVNPLYGLFCANIVSMNISTKLKSPFVAWLDAVLNGVDITEDYIDEVLAKHGFVAANLFNVSVKFLNLTSTTTTASPPDPDFFWPNGDQMDTDNERRRRAVEMPLSRRRGPISSDPVNDSEQDTKEISDFAEFIGLDGLNSQPKPRVDQNPHIPSNENGPQKDNAPHQQLSPIDEKDVALQIADFQPNARHVPSSQHQSSMDAQRTGDIQNERKKIVQNYPKKEMQSQEGNVRLPLKEKEVKESGKNTNGEGNNKTDSSPEKKIFVDMARNIVSLFNPRRAETALKKEVSAADRWIHNASDKSKPTETKVELKAPSLSFFDTLMDVVDNTLNNIMRDKPLPTATVRPLVHSQAGQGVDSSLSSATHDQNRVKQTGLSKEAGQKNNNVTATEDISHEKDKGQVKETDRHPDSKSDLLINRLLEDVQQNSHAVKETGIKTGPQDYDAVQHQIKSQSNTDLTLHPELHLSKPAPHPQAPLFLSETEPRPESTLPRSKPESLSVVPLPRSNPAPNGIAPPPDFKASPHSVVPLSRSKTMPDQAAPQPPVKPKPFVAVPLTRSNPVMHSGVLLPQFKSALRPLSPPFPRPAPPPLHAQDELAVKKDGMAETRPQEIAEKLVPVNRMHNPLAAKAPIVDQLSKADTIRAPSVSAPFKVPPLARFQKPTSGNYKVSALVRPVAQLPVQRPKARFPMQWPSAHLSMPWPTAHLPQQRPPAHVPVYSSSGIFLAFPRNSHFLAKSPQRVLPSLDKSKPLMVSFTEAHFALMNNPQKADKSKHFLSSSQGQQKMSNLKGRQGLLVNSHVLPFPFNGLVGKQRPESQIFLRNNNFHSSETVFNASSLPRGMKPNFHSQTRRPPAKFVPSHPNDVWKKSLESNMVHLSIRKRPGIQEEGSKDHFVNSWLSSKAKESVKTNPSFPTMEEVKDAEHLRLKPPAYKKDKLILELLDQPRSNYEHTSGKDGQPQQKFASTAHNTAVESPKLLNSWKASPAGPQSRTRSGQVKPSYRMESIGHNRFSNGQQRQLPLDVQNDNDSSQKRVGINTAQQQTKTEERTHLTGREELSEAAPAASIERLPEIRPAQQPDHHALIQLGYNDHVVGNSNNKLPDYDNSNDRENLQYRVGSRPSKAHYHDSENIELGSAAIQNEDKQVQGTRRIQNAGHSNW